MKPDFLIDLTIHDNLDELPIQINGEKDSNFGMLVRIISAYSIKFHPSRLQYFQFETSHSDHLGTHIIITSKEILKFLWSQDIQPSAHNGLVFRVE